MTSSKITTGTNDRPRNETIAQTGGGLPDDGGHPIDVSEDEIEQVRQKLEGGDAHDRLMQEVEEEIDLPQKGSA